MNDDEIIAYVFEDVYDDHWREAAEERLRGVLKEQRAEAEEAYAQGLDQGRAEVLAQHYD